MPDLLRENFNFKKWLNSIRKSTRKGLSIQLGKEIIFTKYIFFYISYNEICRYGSLQNVGPKLQITLYRPHKKFGC